jgi:voltage-gated sodium channel
LTCSPSFNNVITFVIVVAAALVGVQTYPSMEYVAGRDTNSAASEVWHALDQVVLYIFTLEVVLKVLAEGNAPWRYFFRYQNPDEEKPMDPDRLPSMWQASEMFAESVATRRRKRKRRRRIQNQDSDNSFSITNIKPDFWNVFDFAVVVVCYLPLGANMVAVIRLFRLLRVLKLVRALPELQVLVVGLLSSLTSIFYVSMLLFLVFYLYAILGVTMLRANDPVHWENLETAFMTLFRMATLEDWTDVMYTTMLGCDVYKTPFRQEWCTDPQPMGWLAGPMFVSFVIVATFVVLNLFIGVINENMGLAKEQLKEMRKQDLHRGMDEVTAGELKTLFDLSKRVKKLHKRVARLHQGMDMAMYDMKMFMKAVEQTGKRYDINEDYTITKRTQQSSRTGERGAQTLFAFKGAKVQPISIATLSEDGVESVCPR